MTEPISKTTMSSLRLLGVLVCMLSATVYGADRVRLKVTVTVTNEKGQPVPGAKVEIDRTGDTDDRGKRVKSITDVTDDQGRFSTTGELRFFELTGKPHKIRVTIPDVDVPFEKEISDQELRQASESGELVVPFPVGISKPQTVRLKVNGRVTSSGQPVEKVQIRLVKPDGTIDFTKTESGKDGWYELASELRLSDESVQVRVEDSKYKTQSRDIDLRSLRAGEENSQAIDISLEPAPTILDDVLQVLKYATLPALFVLGVVGGFMGRGFLDRKKHQQPPNVERRVPDPLLTDISRMVSEIKTSMATKSSLETEISNLTHVVRTSFQQLPITLGRDGASAKNHHHDNSYPHDYREMPMTGVEGAQSWYRKLANKTPVPPDPIYLDVEGARSAAGKLQDSNVYLTQVASSQSALVLFSDGGSIGQVFPNPKVAFRPAALKEVFPDLTEADYEAAKDSVHPMNVRRLDEGRWQVVPT